jgi:cysteine desulfurase / selenocysteine lyase
MAFQKIYMNQAASSWPKAPGVVEAVFQSLKEQPEDPDRSTSWVVNYPARCREHFARLLGVNNPNDVVLTGNATHALNLAVLGVSERISRVVTSVTEHNSVLRPLRHLCRRRKAVIEIVPREQSGELDTELFAQALEKEPDLVVLNHASNVTGRVLNVGPLFKRAKAAGAITLLDASQTVGQMDVRPEELNADLVAFTGHKYLLGPPGTGGLYVSPRLELDQFLVGGTGIRSNLEFHPEDMPLRLEAGTPNCAGWAGMSAALTWLDSERVNFLNKGKKNYRRLLKGLQRISGIELFDSPHPDKNLGIVSLRLKGWRVQEAGYVLFESFNIVCRAGLHCAPLMVESLGCFPEGTLRLSLSGNNSEEEVEAVLAALQKMVQPS